MKTFAFLLFCCSLAAICRSQPDLTKEQVLVFANECKEETGASDEDITAMFKHEAAHSTEAKCMRACVMKKFEILNGDGKLVKDAALQVAKFMAKGDAEKAAKGEEIVEACIDLDVSDDHCEAAEQYGACLVKEAGARGISE